MRQTLSSFGRKAEDYDSIIFCDGSGTTLENPSGWTAYIFVKSFANIEPLVDWTSLPKILKGGLNCGTNNLAEMIPVFQSLWYLRNLQPNVKLKIFVVSDSEWMVRCGNYIYKPDFGNPNGLLWKAISFACSNEGWGYQIEWLHVPRNSTKFHKLCHDSANSCRKSMF